MRRGVDRSICVTFKTLKYGIRNYPAWINIYQLANHIFLQKLLKSYFGNAHFINKIGTTYIFYTPLLVLLHPIFSIILPKIPD